MNYNLRFLLIFSVLGLIYSGGLLADWVKVTGVAPYSDTQYGLSRENARDDAYKQALMQSGVHVSSRQQVVNGQLKQDEITVSGESRIRRAQVSNEYVSDGKLYLEMNIELEEVPVCHGSQASQYKKKLAVLGFSVQEPRQTVRGDLGDVDRGLAGALRQALQDKKSLVVYENSHELLFGDVRNAPSGFTKQNTLTDAADFAKDIGAQFVVSGVVRDLGVKDEQSFSTSYWQKLKNMVSYGNLERTFSVDLFVHDGFNGAIIWQRNFSVSGVWDDSTNTKTGFASSAFWHTDYGRAVREEIDLMADIVDEQLRCQPFMTRISRVNGKTLHFASGANTGIRPGDKLSLYRTFNFYDADQLEGVELTNVKAALTVSQVHPDFASGTVSVDPGRLNIQEDDLLIAW